MAGLLDTFCLPGRGWSLRSHPNPRADSDRGGSSVCAASATTNLDRSALWLLLLLVPVVGVLVVSLELGFRRGSVGENGFGTDPREFESSGRDYATVA